MTITTYIVRLDPSAVALNDSPARYLVPPWWKGHPNQGWDSPETAYKAMRELLGQEGEESVHIDGWSPQLVKLSCEDQPWPPKVTDPK